jgi:transketolase|tara:strand:+ start:542 stop:1354 length:813 start_codon:yes stop_codon:yes gene_type:complete
MSTKDLAKKIRFDALRMTHKARSGHIGSILSIADILAVLYGKFLKVDPNSPENINRDYIILSKGHAAAGLYAVLSELGFINNKELDTFYQNGSRLLGHVHHAGIPGVEFSAGSLGHGLPVGIGLALASRMDHRPNRTAVLMSDGELNEGSCWEAFHFAGVHEIGNIFTIIDYNGFQSLGSTEEILSLEPLSDKISAFRWEIKIIDGHSHQKLAKVLDDIKFSPKNRPTCIIAKTIKGKGVSFMENDNLWHNKSPQGSDYEKALQELQINL